MNQWILSPFVPSVVYTLPFQQSLAEGVWGQSWPFLLSWGCAYVLTLLSRLRSPAHTRRGGQAGGTGGGARQGHPGAPTDRGGSNTDTQNAGATPGGTRVSTVDKEEGHSEAGEATRTAGTGNRNGADGRACAWEAATTKGMAWPVSPVATVCQGNPCSTGIRWGVSPVAQMGCLRNRSGSPSGADQP